MIMSGENGAEVDFLNIKFMLNIKENSKIALLFENIVYQFFNGFR